MNTSNQQTQMPFSRKKEMLQEFCGYVAKCGTFFSREGTGYRNINMTWTVGIAIAISTFGSVFTWFSKRDFGGVYELFPVILVVTAAWQKHKRWKEIESGELKHSRADGISYLEKLPWLPEFMTKNRRLYRVIEPLMFFIGAMLMGEFISQPLGRLMAFVAVADWVYEAALYDHRLNAALDILDGRLEAEGQQKIVEHFEPRQGAQDHLESGAAEAIASGMARDILNNIQTRRAKRKALATVTPE